MIEIFADDRCEEARRIHDVLMAEGLMQSDVADAAPSELCLTHVAAVDQIDTTPRRWVVFGGEDRAATAVSYIRRGAVDYLPNGVSQPRIVDTVRSLLLPSRDKIAVSAAMQRTFDLAARVAHTNVAVLIAGPSGTGKEVIAQFIHRQSERQGKPFVAMNCAAIPESILEATLFGHEKGAFTGAQDKRVGKFELAHGGTLLLDEITEMPTALQAKLLRVLQEGEVERLGSNTLRQVDVRVLATTNRDVRQAVADGVLREDLYYRLSVFPIHIPPLANRRDDVLPLSEFFIQKYAPGRGLVLSQDAERALHEHSWPGNVRELENSIQRAIVMSRNGLITDGDLGLEPTASSSSETSSATLQGQMRHTEEALLLETLRQHGGARQATAAALGISERTLRHKIKQIKDRGIAVQ